MLEPLLERFRQGDRLALARLLTLVARGEQVEAIRAGLPDAEAGRTRVVAVTGSGGVGKSTLIGKLIEPLRARGWTVAVLACDPESDLTGGALLADRVRMPSRPEDPGVFIRSMTAARGHEGIAEHLDRMIELLRAFRFDVVLLETAGVGQGDTAVWAVADVVVLLLQPETGDEFQWEKAGLLEVADVVVVHKADLPGAERTEAQVRGLLNLPGCRAIPVLRASSDQGWGLEDLWQIVESLPARTSRAEPDGRALLRLAQQRLARRFHHQADDVEPILDRWRRHELDDGQAADELLQALIGKQETAR
ncbi:MAG TPA: AAA family ATPase [Isosphaeraceae bacterium]|nr:AAA family ATPase [Isosphaeraceae bacterium]